MTLCVIPRYSAGSPAEARHRCSSAGDSARGTLCTSRQHARSCEHQGTLQRVRWSPRAPTIPSGGTGFQPVLPGKARPSRNGRCRRRRVLTTTCAEGSRHVITSPPVPRAAPPLPRTHFLCVIPRYSAGSPAEARHRCSSAGDSALQRGMTHETDVSSSSSAARCAVPRLRMTHASGAAHP
jgi:hypothetical protein